MKIFIAKHYIIKHQNDFLAFALQQKSRTMNILDQEKLSEIKIFVRNLFHLLYLCRTVQTTAILKRNVNNTKQPHYQKQITVAETLHQWKKHDNFIPVVSSLVIESSSASFCQFALLLKVPSKSGFRFSLALWSSCNEN